MSVSLYTSDGRLITSFMGDITKVERFRAQRGLYAVFVTGIGNIFEINRIVGNNLYLRP